jgi:murein DD-endopeptidase MepM/ murein hydrolase activator NlpD
VRVKPKSDRSFLVRVPLEATSGPLRLEAGPYARFTTKSLAILPPPPPESSATLTPVPGPRDPDGPTIETGTSNARAFIASRNVVKFAYRVSDDGPVSVTVDLIHPADGAVVRSWTPPPVSPGVVNTIKWDGKAADGGMAAEGRYAFRVSASDTAGFTAKSAQADNTERDAFDLYGHIFPVRGRHNYGGAGARFGAGRAGHTHQGHDVMASCGTRLVAARGGVVKYRQYHSAAGNYLIIDGDNTDVDYAYMHLREPSPFGKGDRVYTGQQIGVVGRTGDATACHLHFEMWTAPGWYEGGSPFDPLPSLKAWDAVS